jgi:uncharacterized protein YndB with AHSA1/START domain
MATKTLTFRRTIHAPPTETYRAFTNSTAWREWMSDLAFATPEKGGRLYLAWNSGYYAHGKYLTADPAKKVAFTWHGVDEPAPSKVQVNFKTKNGATEITLTHSRIGSGKAWAKTVKAIQKGWEQSLENLQSVLETGHDLRFTLRPMLGVMIDSEMDAESAKKYGMPVNYGVRLSSTIEGMGARAAGLEGGDVIVGIGAKKVTNWPSVSAALQELRAGQTVKVIFYRNGEKHTALMPLSARPLPEVPASAADLAAYARKMYADLDAQLAEAFKDASEAEANHKSTPDEWSAKEVVAHLLIGERDQHSGITDSILGNQRQYDGAFDNSSLRTRVVAESYPTVTALLADLTRMEIETVKLIEGMPLEYVARKGSFWPFAYGYTQAADHNNEHLRQIKAAIAAARQEGKR